MNKRVHLLGRILPSPYEMLFPGQIVVEDGRIAEIVGRDEPIPSDEMVFDHGESILFPGLIDTHCHLCLPGDGTMADAHLSSASPATLVNTGVVNARRALSAGITSLRDLGSPYDMAFVVRRTIGEPGSHAPRIFAAGAPLTIPSGHLAAFGGTVDGLAAIERRIELLVEAGADVIKVIASDSGGPKQDSRLPFSPSALALIVRIAHRFHLPVAAHVTSPAAIAACIKAGVDGLEHVGFWEGNSAPTFRPDLATAMEQQGIYIAPTIQAIYRTAKELKDQTEADRQRREKTFSDTIKMVRHLLEYNLRFVSGTDAGWLLNPFGDLPLGLELMVEIGMSNADALAMATVTAAAALGMKERLGRLGPRMEADILVLPGSPLDRIDNLRLVEAVYSAGQPVAIQLDSSGVGSAERKLLWKHSKGGLRYDER